MLVKGSDSTFRELQPPVSLLSPSISWAFFLPHLLVLSVEQHNFFEKLVRLQTLTSLLQAYRIRISYGEHPLEICVHICP